MDLSEILSEITDEKTLKKWKNLAAKNIKKFARNTNPYNKLKISDFYLRIDTKTKTYGIILTGNKPNVGHVKGFGAPVNKYTKSPNPIHYEKNGRWYTTYKERETSNNLGAKPLEMAFYGEVPKEYFGLKRKGAKVAFGLVNDEAVPVYSDEGLVEYISINQQEELERILFEAGYTVIGG